MEGVHKKVLVSPLDWGLGHATRCIPIIRKLMEHQYEVVIAASGPSGILLQQVFPELLHLRIPAHTFTYSRTPLLFAVRIIQQIPKLIQQTRKEHEWLQEQQEIHCFDAIISDNRFGMYHPAIPSIFITHQLGLKTGLGRVIDRMIQKIKFRKLRRFNTCWVPDVASGLSAAGSLSHPKYLPDVPVEYIGWLSGIDPADVPVQEDHVLILLSGPEPLRTQWEEQLMQELKSFPQPVSFIRGLPQDATEPVQDGNKTYYPNASRALLSKLISSASCIICRSGYSSVMDILHLGKKAVLIPTPGQPEQEYLARHLAASGIAPYIAQKDFTLTAAMELYKQYPYNLPDVSACNTSNFIVHLEKLLQHPQSNTL